MQNEKMGKKQQREKGSNPSLRKHVYKKTEQNQNTAKINKTKHTKRRQENKQL